ncbi:tRNA pseudouridine(55) synthase TruB [Synechococcus sp. CS-602]|nr:MULTISPECIES: tRNA pseudouridine(55) synthase TruB [unclassified Synechococcus]APD48523.1 tRNA pseudouridine(55) synthase TruB [Synechococcus sp. SynAce01]MCT0205320.1 tRNA pseudouridine(55) synthase TruB [Synechococcus sp. CS-602]MCT0246814.1 tRNA pseudouridine(55) synthase TruB [Synechococcus sp. CS-601]MCT4367883.1 tRNA pseudouridine(55) synthase TruB [Candidatus Regnicoccus frigidus MAG-AL2]
MAQPCGFLVLDKPAGLTSHACVARVRRRYGLKRVGHGGTLDPAVTGVLPIALGSATRLLPYLPGGKAYRGTIQLGLRTSSDDLTGELLERAAVPDLSPQLLDVCLEAFRGPILQRPPQVSAVHVDGERAYVRARRGETSALEPRPVTIHQLELLGWDGDNQRLELAVSCSAGTYIRSLARDLGAALGCGGALACLRRTEALGFGLAGSVSLERLEEDPLPALQPPLAALAHLPQHRVLAHDWAGWRCGRSQETSLVLALDQAVVVLGPDGSLAGMARLAAEGRLQPRLVLDPAG